MTLDVATTNPGALPQARSEDRAYSARDPVPIVNVMMNKHNGDVTVLNQFA